MKFPLRLLPFVLLFFLSGAALAEPGLEVRKSALTIGNAQQAIDGGSLVDPGLEGEIATLTSLLNGTALDDANQTSARYFRGRAAVLINQLRLKNKRPADSGLAQRAIADFDWVAERGVEVRPLRVSAANALYLAGLVSRSFLADAPRAYAYWAKCAQREQAGCLYLMASAKVSGEGGVAVDVPGALKLHKKVYDTGTDFSCAGAFSALATAQIIYFSGAQQLTVGDLDWLKRSDLLLDELAKDRKWTSPCKRPRFMLTEYLIRLDRGEDRRSLLESAAKIAQDPELKATAGFLLGGVSEAAFLEAAAKATDRDGACEMHFEALWHAEIRKDAQRSQNHFRALSGMGPNHCSLELALAKMKYRR